MSKEIKQLIKDAKQAFAEKQFKIAEEKCHVSYFKVWICLCQGILSVELMFFFIGSSKGRSEELFRQFIVGCHLSRK